MDPEVGPEGAGKIAVVEVLDRDGHARLVVPVWRWPVSIGRAIDCDVVLDDAHVAAHHATLSATDSGLALNVGDTINGAQWSHTRLRAGEHAPLPAGEVFQLGTTRLRVRRPTDDVAPERPVVPDPPAGRLPLPGLITALFAWTVAARWVTTDPGGRLTGYLEVVVPVAAGLVAWCGVWALASKLFRHRFEFWPHARIAVSYLLVAECLGLLLPIAAAMFGWVLLSRVAGLTMAAVTSAMVVAHLSRVLPARRRLLGMVMATLFAAGTAVVATLNYQSEDRIFGELYVSALTPPAIRLAAAVDPARFIEEARDLKATLDAHVNDDDGDDDDGFDLMSETGGGAARR